MITKADKISGIIVAAGNGTRMGGVSKPLIPILDKTLFEYVAEAFDVSDVFEITVVCSKENIDILKEKAKIKKPISFVLGGATRALSVNNGVSVSHGDIICVHDCARPFVTAEMINKVSEAARDYGCAAACKKVTDTIRYIRDDGTTFTPEREKLIALETPQAFKKDIYLSAFSAGDAKGFTDETSLIESYGVTTKHIVFKENNIKLTVPSDITVATALAKERKEAGKL